MILHKILLSNLKYDVDKDIKKEAIFDLAVMMLLISFVLQFYM